jgi:hypothetical protein
VWVEPPRGSGPLPDGTFSIDEIALEEAAPSYRLNAGASVEWRRPGVLLALGNTPILEDLSLGNALETGLQGDPFSPSAPSGYGMVSRTQGELRLLGTRIKGSLRLSFRSGEAAWNAGHEISRAFGPFSLGESFSASAGDETLTHRLKANLASPLIALAEGNLVYENRRLERTWKASLGVAAAPGRPLGGILEGEAKWIETGREARWFGHYGEAWVKSWEPMLPNLGAQAQKRDMRGQLRLSLTTLPVGLELSAQGISGFSRAGPGVRGETRLRLDSPFNFGEFRGLIRGERTFKRTLRDAGRHAGRNAGRNALDDGRRYFESLGDSRDLWLSIPFYALFDPALEGTMRRTLENAAAAEITEYGLFTDAFSLSLHFPGRFDVGSLFIPRSLEASLSRSLEKKLDTSLDLLNLGALLRFSAINLFGAFGVRPLFSFYQSDEFSHAVNTSFAIPKKSRLSWRIQDEMSMIFYGFSGSELALLNTLTVSSLRDDAAWLESLRVSWTAPAPNSLLGIFYDWAAGKIREGDAWPALSHLAARDYERLRRETLELRFDASPDSLSSSIVLGHESIIRVLGRLYLSVFEKLSCAQNYRTGLFSFLGTLGLSVSLSF